jgi:hypothetical protein
MVYQVSTRFLDHGLSFWKKLRFHLKQGGKKPRGRFTTDLDESTSGLNN